VTQNLEGSTSGYQVNVGDIKLVMSQTVDLYYLSSLLNPTIRE
jgi:hypothetical protein